MKKIIFVILLTTLNLQSQVEIVNRPMHSAVIDTALNYQNLIDVGGKKTDTNIQKFLKSVGLSGEQPYCQAFVYYCHSVNGIAEFKTGLANGYYSSLKKKYGVGTRHAVSVENKQGIICWKYPNSSKGHDGFILNVPIAGYVRTLEGNTSYDNSSVDGRLYSGKKGVFSKIRRVGRLGQMKLRGIIQ